MFIPIKSKKENSERLFRISFLFLFFGIWLGLPFFNANFNDEKSVRFLVAIFPINLTSVFLFFINTELLMPRILPKYGIKKYMIYLFLLIIIFIAIQYFMREWLIFSHNNGKNRGFNSVRFVFFNVFPVIMIAAISTVYGFINFLSKEEKNKQTEKEERLNSELSFLRSQISPHFIFNVLNSIVYLIRSKSDLAESVTIKLSELMRYMLYESESEQVSLDKELNYLKNYIELQKVRFEEDVSIHLKIEGTQSSQLIEPMLLIPFVENAFKHGVGMIENPSIDIYSRSSESEIFFEVKNKITPENSEAKDRSSGIGLKNVKRRLELLYPNQHSLDILQENNYFIIRLKLRFKTF
jgi:two-component system LytT family sensor kinase